MSNIKKVRDGENKFDLVVPEKLPEYFADGFSFAMIGMPLCKIVFHSISAAGPEEPSEPGVETRHAAFQVTLPLISLLELAGIANTAVMQGKEEINKAVESYRQMLEQKMGMK